MFSSVQFSRSVVSDSEMLLFFKCSKSNSTVHKKGGSDSKESACNVGNPCLILVRKIPAPVFLPGESQGQEAWWAAIYRVAQSRTGLKRCSSSSSRKIPWRRDWLRSAVFLLGEFYGWRSLAGNIPWGLKESDMTEQLTLFFSTLTHFFFSPQPSVFITEMWSWFNI